MSVLQAIYFDGKTSRKHPVSVLISGGQLKVVGRDVSEAFDARRVRRSLRIAGTPRWLYLPGGGACVTSDNDTVDRITRDRHYEVLLHKWESRPAYAALAVALVVAVMWLLIDRGLPAAAEQVAKHVPIEAEAELGRQTLEGLEKYILKPTRIPARRQAALRERLFELAEAGGDETPYRVEFRASPIFGANAFALPSGIIVMTDELAKLARDDRELLAVLAHELGHVHHRHTMRRLLEGSATALVIAGVTGDIASTTSIAAAAPALLMQTKYSRDNEREADAYAIGLMRKSGIPPHFLTAILKRLESAAPRRGGVPTFLSSHPSTDERESIALAGAAGSKVESKTAGEKLATQEAEELKLFLLSPVQRQVVTLVEQRKYEELERLLGGHQAKFEQDPGTSLELEVPFYTFYVLPRRDEAALSEWMAKMPTSYSATVARGIYYLGRGLTARGTEFIQDTSPDDIRAMKALLAKAQVDLEKSLGMTKSPYLSRYWLISLSQNVGGRGSAKAHYVEALKFAPQSVELRLEYMRSLEPRWGGSIADLEAFVNESAAQLRNPAARARIAAQVPAYRAFESVQAKDYPQALKFRNEAIQLYPGATLLCERSALLNELKRHAEAFADVKLALSKSRRNEYCLKRAVGVAQQVRDWKEVVTLMNLVLEVNPESTGAYNQRGWAYEELGKHDLAFQDYLAAAKLGESYAQAAVGRMYMNGTGTRKDLEQAVVWFRKAAAQGQPESKALLARARRSLGKK